MLRQRDVSCSISGGLHSLPLRHVVIQGRVWPPLVGGERLIPVAKRRRRRAHLDSLTSRPLPTRLPRPSLRRRDRDPALGGQAPQKGKVLRRDDVPVAAEDRKREDARDVALWIVLEVEEGVWRPPDRGHSALSVAAEITQPHDQTGEIELAQVRPEPILRRQRSNASAYRSLGGRGVNGTAQPGLR